METGKVLGNPIQTAVRIGSVKGKGTEWEVKSIRGSEVQGSMVQGLFSAAPLTVDVVNLIGNENFPTSKIS
jgi:hypothetical protein